MLVVAGRLVHFCLSGLSTQWEFPEFALDNTNGVGSTEIFSQPIAFLFGVMERLFVFGVMTLGSNGKSPKVEMHYSGQVIQLPLSSCIMQ